MSKNLFLMVTVVICMAFGSFSGVVTAQDLTVNSAQETHKRETFDKLIEMARRKGSAHVIVGLQMPFVPEGNLNKAEISKQHSDIKQAQNYFLARFQSFALGNVKLFDYIPYLAFETNAEALEQMRDDGLIIAIQEDEIAQPALAESTPIVGANAAWANGYTGLGQTVAILDSGVDKNHTFLSGKVISEACYSSNNASSTSVCPSAVTESTASNSGLNCPTTTNGCAHGTNVAGIAAGKGTTFSGVAKDANIIAIQMFSQFTGTTNCGSTSPCALYWTSDLIRGLERVRTLANTMNNIVAVNLSLQTGQQFASNCNVEHAATKAAIDNLRSVGIATVICSGNFAFTNALTAPACISTAISVGATDDGSLGTTLDAVSNFSDSSPLLHLLAPGRWINSSIPDNLFSNYSGTSMAAPHVVGALAILKQRKPSATIDRMLNALIATGQPITDTRNGIVKPRIRINDAVQAIGINTPFDFDGDRKTDISIFRPSLGQWWFLRSSNNSNYALQFGNSTDKLVPADYTGDGKADVAIFRPSTGEWFVLRSNDFSYYAFPFGISSDIPAPGDYDGDGKADAAVFRASTGTWYVNNSTNGGTQITNFGINGDVPVSGDFDGDNKTDIAVFRRNTLDWWILRSSNGTVFGYNFGAGITVSINIVPGDYTGDGKTDAAFIRDNNWFVLRSEPSPNENFYVTAFGSPGDIAAPGDYDGDGRFDLAVFRPSNNTWYVQGSTAGNFQIPFGTNGDFPIPNVLVR